MSKESMPSTQQVIPAGGSETPLRASSVGGEVQSRSQTQGKYPRRTPTRVTLAHEGKHYRATVAQDSYLVPRSTKHGILAVPRHCKLSTFRVLLRQGKLQEISQEQALRLLSMLPKAKGTSPNDYAPRKHKGVLLRFRVECELNEGVKKLSLLRGVPMTRLIKQWMRIGLALEMDKETSK